MGKTLQPRPLQDPPCLQPSSPPASPLPSSISAEPSGTTYILKAPYRGLCPPPRTDGTFSPPRTPVSPALLVGAIHPPAGVPARLPGPSSVPGGAGLEREKGGLRGLRAGGPGLGPPESQLLPTAASRNYDMKVHDFLCVLANSGWLLIQSFLLMDS